MSIVAPPRAQGASRATADWAFVAAVVIGAVLRFWDLGHAAPSIDETYTALAAQLPLAEVIGHIDATDPHGPLPYLVLQPLAGQTSEVGVLRALSALASAAAVALFALWQRHRGVAGLVAVALFAVAPYQLAYGRQIRMYGLLSLGGVAAAYCATRWLQDPRRGWALGATAAALVVAYSHAVGVLLLAALLAVPVLRRTRAAWEFRVVVVSALAIFAVSWGAHTLTWSGRGVGYPTASPDWVAVVVNETIAAVPDNRWLIGALVVAGGVLLVQGGTEERTVWLALFVLPIVALTAASLERGVLVPRSLMPFAWGAPLALGAVAGYAFARSRVWGGVVVALLAVLSLGSVSAALFRDEGSGDVMARAQEVVGRDGVVVASDRWQHRSLVEWYGFASSGVPVGVDDGAVPGGTVLWDARSAPPDRFWLFGEEGVDAPELEPCGPVREIGVGFTVQCVEIGTVGSGDAS
jgi:uncharacterized membrane protein